MDLSRRFLRDRVVRERLVRERLEREVECCDRLGCLRCLVCLVRCWGCCGERVLWVRGLLCLAMRGGDVRSE